MADDEAPAPETGQDIAKRMEAEPSLDHFYRTNPRNFSESEIRNLIKAEREKRALYITKKEQH